MNKTLDTLSRLVTARPYITIITLTVITVVMVAGCTLRASPIEGSRVGLLPTGHPITNATREIDEFFREAGEVSIATLLFRENALTPQGISQMDALIKDIVNEPSVKELLVPVDPIVSPALLINSVLQLEDFESITQAQIDAVLNIPEIQTALAAITGTDADGTPVAIASIRLIDTEDERTQIAERKINELAKGDDGPLRVSSLSPVVIQNEYEQAIESGMGPLVGIALLLIALLLLIFTRTFSDMLLTLTGLILSIIWVVGAEGWIGPNGLKLIGPPSSLTSIVPVIVISLTVDYAIQTISHYREERLEGQSVMQAIQKGLRNVTLPLSLAAVTTIVSLLASLFSPISVIGDFGIVAGLGVGMSLIVMLTLIPAGRTIIDRRREARGKLKPPRPISNALPGVASLAEVLAKNITRWPAPYLVVVIIATILLGWAARGLESEFNVIRDILPRGGNALQDIDTLDVAVGGSTEIASILVKAEATEIRTLLNLQDLNAAFEDEQQRPAAAAGPIQTSYYLYMRDWIEDTGEPDDKYDPELAALFQQASDGVQLDPEIMQEFLNNLTEREPELTRFLVNNPQGVDIMLLRFPSYTNDSKKTKALQHEIETLWLGDDSEVTAISSDVISVAVQNQITERQTEAITTTIAVGLTILSVFFWVTLRQPTLGIVAIGPIILVLICVLGTMALLNIPYSLITSIITALSIGIGVDYTIHVIHSYREEFGRSRDPERAAVRALRITGAALLGSALTTALGFSILIASPLLASQQFGITATITIVYSLIVSVVVVLPAMTVWGAYQNMRLRSMVQRQWDELDETIEELHRRHEQKAESS